jgi:hypothetical protein
MLHPCFWFVLQYKVTVIGVRPDGQEIAGLNALNFKTPKPG